MNQTQIDSVLTKLSNYEFTTAEFIYALQLLHPEKWAEIVLLYGVGGKNNPGRRPKTSHTFIANVLTKLKKSGRVIARPRALAPVWWGNKWINLWQCTVSNGTTGRFSTSLSPDPGQQTPQETTKVSEILSRMGQGKFRLNIIKQWDNKCAISGCENLAMLRASHIKPWCKSDNAERLDPDNGLLLIPNIDALFDIGFVSFKDNGNIIISKKITSSDIDIFKLSGNKIIKKLNKTQCRYMAYHRQNIFKQ